MKKFQNLIYDVDEWFHKQRAFVQIAVLMSVGFVVIASLIAIFA